MSHQSYRNIGLKLLTKDKHMLSGQVVGRKLEIDYCDFANQKELEIAILFDFVLEPDLLIELVGYGFDELGVSTFIQMN